MLLVGWIFNFHTGQEVWNKNLRNKRNQENYKSRVLKKTNRGKNLILLVFWLIFPIIFFFFWWKNFDFFLWIWKGNFKYQKIVDFLFFSSGKSALWKFVIFDEIFRWIIEFCDFLWFSRKINYFWWKWNLANSVEENYLKFWILFECFWLIWGSSYFSGPLFNVGKLIKFSQNFKTVELKK